MKTKNLHRQEVHISYTCKAATTDIAGLLCGECLWPRLPQPPDTARRDTRGSASYSDEFKDALLDGEALLYGLMVISPCLLAARKKLSGSQNILCNDLHLVADMVGDRKPHLLYTQDGNLTCNASLATTGETWQTRRTAAGRMATSVARAGSTSSTMHAQVALCGMARFVHLVFSCQQVTRTFPQMFL